MAAKSPIEWTQATWNPVTGCTKISPGCKNCYAEGVAAIELNISCPNIKEGGIQFGCSLNGTFDVVNAVRKVTTLPVIPKLTPNVTDVASFARRTGAIPVGELARLEAMKEKHPVIGDVRGKGLLLGLELVTDRRTKELVPKALTESLFQECLRRGLVAMSYTPIIRINPPLNIDEATALEGLDILDEAIGAVFP